MIMLDIHLTLKRPSGFNRSGKKKKIKVVLKSYKRLGK